MFLLRANVTLQSFFYKLTSFKRFLISSYQIQRGTIFEQVSCDSNSRRTQGENQRPFLVNLD